MRSTWIIAFAALIGSSAFKGNEQMREATITVYKGYDKGSGLGTGTVQFYGSNSEIACKGWKKIGNFSWITGMKKRKNLPADVPLFIAAQTNRLTVGGPVYNGVAVDGASCRNLVQFTPKAGAKYDVRQNVLIGQSCTLDVVIEGTNDAPSDLKHLPPMAC